LSKEFLDIPRVLLLLLYAIRLEKSLVCRVTADYIGDGWNEIALG